MKVARLQNTRSEMALVGYESSDEDEDVAPLPPAEEPQVGASKPAASSPKAASDNTLEPPAQPEEVSARNVASAATNGAKHLLSPGKQASEPAIGPVLPSETIGPSLPPAEASLEYPEEMDEEEDAANAPAPASPYSASRALLRDLTLPTVPNLDIPPSPPGSPPPGINARFDQFLELKRKKGTHFNARVAQSAALKNPALMDKLLGFVGIDSTFDDGNDGTEQYATTLPGDLWDPKGFPEWAFCGQLRRSQDKLQKEKTRATGQGVEFVPASSNEPSRHTSKTATAQVTGKRKSRFDIQ